MDAPLEAADDEVTRLRDCLDDLVSIMALPALSTGEPAQIAGALVDALMGTLRLGFVCVRLIDPEGGRSIETLRVAESLQDTAGAQEISQALDSSLVDTPPRWAARAQVVIRDVEVSVAFAPLGLRGEIGTVVTGSQRSDFPTQTERLLLDVAANQAVVGLQRARLLREEALGASGRNLKLIIDTIPALAWSARPDGSAEFFNRHYLDFIGLSAEQAGGWGWTAAVHPDDLDGLAATWHRIMASEAPGETEARLRRHDGAYRWFLFRTNPLRDQKGMIVKWYGINTDIEDRKRAEDALRKSERQFRLLVETIPALVWCGSPEGELDYLNQRAVEYLGHTPDSLAGGRWLELVHPDQRDATVRRWLHSATTGSSYADVYQLRRADGQYRWIQSLGEPFHDTGGRIAYWYGQIIDIDDRKRAEVELRRAYDSFADAQRLSKTGSFITDLVGDDHNWSEETYRIFEFEPGTKVSVQRIQAIIHPDDRPSFEAMIGRAMSGVDVTFSFRIVTAHGAEKHVRGIAHVIEKIEGRPMFVGALQDVTESMVAEEALNRARSELAHVARVATLSTLTASIAHEVNQPLSGIINNAGTCLRMLDAVPPNVDGARETARRTIRDGHRASEVVTRLRALFRKKEFTLEPLDLNEATQEVVTLSLGELQRNRVIVQSELADDLPSITGDRVQLQQVILNLLRNASDAMVGVHDRPRRLLIRTEREDGDRVRVTVRDAGTGFDRQSMDRLFDPFYTTKSDGMGIGLSVSRSIVERHHGRLWAEANDGPGAAFSFSIPRGADSVRDPALVMKHS